jgi:hypothetical protein
MRDSASVSFIRDLCPGLTVPRVHPTSSDLCSSNFRLHSFPGFSFAKTWSVGALAQSGLLVYYST